MNCSPQRYLANNRNLLRPDVAVALAPSSVEAVEDLVTETPLARDGSAAVEFSGAYIGAEQALYEVEVTDTAADVPTISAPVYAGAGSSRLVDIAATGLDAQEIVVELVDAGRPATRAAVSFEGVNLQARALGVSGNAINVSIDQSGLAFAATDFALLTDLTKGQGGPNDGLEGAGFDWNTAILGADDVIPASAKRIAFGDDRSTVYLAYKQYDGNRWLYHFVPELKRDVPKGTPVKFVTGGRIVTITDGVTPEVYTDIETVYDLLSQIRASSALCTVDGVVANDRSPTGQASLELLVRTDAHVEPSSGSGSEYARAGLSNAFANANAGTELVILRCYATSGAEDPRAHIGAERWYASSSLGGDLGEVVTGVPFIDPVAAKFGLTIPVRLPPGFGTKQGKFSYVTTNYMPRDEGVENPPVCPVSLTAGIAAVDQQITLRWTKRPSGECGCEDMPVPKLSARCLGLDITEGDDDAMSYSSEARDRLTALYDWAGTTSSALSKYVAGKERDGIPETTMVPSGTEGENSFALASRAGQGESTFSGNGYVETPDPFAADIALEDTHFPDDVPQQINEVLGIYSNAIGTLDAVEDAHDRTSGFEKWDDALAELIADTTAITRLKGFTVEKYRVLVGRAIAYAGIIPLGKTEASALTSGDGCWQDHPEEQFYFSVEGSVGGGYAPLFVNHPYYSARKGASDDVYLSTKEFGLQVNVECPSRLLVGDTIILALGDAGYPPTYQVGDEIVLPVIAAAPLYLAGGRDDDSTQTWSVTGDVHGPFAPWQFEPGASETATGYADAGLSFNIAAGGIPNVKGDRHGFRIVGGHWSFRVNSGAWSAPQPISTSPTALDAGLAIQFVPGAGECYATGDLYQFTALQPWAVSNLRTPAAGKRWRWAVESDGPFCDFDFGSAQDMDTFAIADHTIPVGASILLEGGLSASGEWSEAITWRDGAIVQTLSATRSARYVRLTLVDAGGGYIGWAWLGMALKTALAAQVQTSSAYKMARSTGPLYEGASTLGKTKSATVVWTEAALEENDGQALLAMFEHLKDNDDEPMILIPHVNRPQDAIYGKIVADETDFTELSDHQRNDTAKRRYGGSMAVQGVWRAR